jgi:hypothetical protein
MSKTRLSQIFLSFVVGVAVAFVVPPIKRSHAFGGGTIGGSFSTSGTPFTGTATFPGSTAIVNLGSQALSAGAAHTLNFLANLTLTPGTSPPQISVEALIAP